MELILGMQTLVAVILVKLVRLCGHWCWKAPLWNPPSSNISLRTQLHPLQTAYRHQGRSLGPGNSSHSCRPSLPTTKPAPVLRPTTIRPTQASGHPGPHSQLCRESALPTSSLKPALGPLSPTIRPQDPVLLSGGQTLDLRTRLYPLVGGEPALGSPGPQLCSPRKQQKS